MPSRLRIGVLLAILAITGLPLMPPKRDFHGRVKQAVGAITAARFAQVEHQLLLIIDLRIASALPVAERGS
jgi:hypothetical protein